MNNRTGAVGRSACVLALAVLATAAMAADYEMVSPAGNYRISATALSEKTTGTLELIEESTSAVLATIAIPPAKPRSAPVAVWRDETSDVAIGLDTHNRFSPAYIFSKTEDGRYLAQVEESFGALTGYIGRDTEEFIRLKLFPVEWRGTPVTGHIVLVTGQCWDQSGQRYTRRNEPIVVYNDGRLGYR